MILLNRRDAARFRGALRRCVVGRPRDFAPAVVLNQTKDELTLSAIVSEVGLSLRVPVADRSTIRPGRLIIPVTLLATIEANGNGDVTLEESAAGCVHCRWQEGADSKEVEGESIPPESAPARLPSPGSWKQADSSLLAALHACGKAAARNDSPRFGLTRLQLRGEDGQVAGTDGRQLLFWGGFSFPFEDNLLVPAVPLFGGRELTSEIDIKVGRTTKHVVISIGPWAVWLTIDSTARFPDVMSVMPRSSRMSRIVVDDHDAVEILRKLQDPPKVDEDEASVALVLGSYPALRIMNGTADVAKEIELARSSGSGPRLSVTIDRRYMARGLSLGLREIRAASSQEAVQFRDEHRSYLVARIDSAKTTASPEPNERSALVPAAPIPSIHNGDPAMKSDGNGHSPSERPVADEAVNPLVEAEALRAALTEVVRRVGRLIVGLRQFQKERRALQTAWTSLKHLRLTSQEEP